MSKVSNNFIFYLAGKASYVIEDTILDDNGIDQSVHSLAGTSRSSPSSQGIDRIEKFSRKVFVGGLPPDIDEGMLNILILYREK